jgi:PAS domain S-box-containing protein
MEERLKLLLVEDDQIDQLAFKRFVEREKLPYEYQMAGSVHQARAVLIEEGRFDAVVIDYLLGDGTAFDLFDEIGDSPTVVITGSGDEAIAVRAMKAGVYDYLVKDAEGSYLTALPITIDKAIEHQRAQEELRRYREHLEEMVAERTAGLTQANQQLRAEIAERRRAEAALRESQTEIQQLKEFNESIVQNMAEGIIIQDADGHITFVNPAAAALLDCAPQELTGQHWTAIIPPDQHHLGRAADERHACGQADRYELELVRRDGTRIPVLVSSSPRFEGNRFVGSMAVFSDITKRVRAERLLRALNQAALAVERVFTLDEIFYAVAEEFKKLGLSCLVLPMDESRSRLFIKYMSHENEIVKAAEKLVGIQREEFGILVDRADTYWEVVKEKKTIFRGESAKMVRELLPKPVKRLAGQIARMLKISKSIVAPLIVEDQVIGVFAVLSTELVEDDIPAITAFAHQFAATWRKTQLFEQAQREISERVRAEEEIRRRNRELQLLNRVIAASAAELEPERMLDTACRELAKAFELPQAAAGLLNVEKTHIVVVAEYRPQERPPLLNKTIPLKDILAFQHLITHNEPLALEDAQHDPRLLPIHDLVRQRGVVSALFLPFVVKGETVGGLSLGAVEPRHFSAEEVSLAQSVADQISGVLVRTRLDEERRHLEEQYHQAQKMEAVGLLAGGIAHDFNNLLTAINGFAEMLQFQLSPDDPVQEMVERILGSGRRAADLVRQLLAFSRKQIIQPQVIDLNAAVTNMEKMLKRIIGEDIHLKTSLATELWPVEVDPAQIEQVIVNLAVNARDAMPAGGDLAIETANVVLGEEFAAQSLGAQPGEYVLLIVSDTGVGMSEAVKTHIFEPFFTTKEQGKGTGLGMATAYGIVTQSGGHIHVDSEEGRGTTFKIYLPRSKAAPQPLPGLHVGRDIPSGHETILLVEDDVHVRELTLRVLQRQGYNVLEARDGEDARRLATNHAGPIHLLLTDIVMPGISGMALAGQLTQIRPELKTLFMSGYTDEAIAHHGVLDPDVALLQKPFSPVTLARQVRQVLDAR